MEHGPITRHDLEADPTEVIVNYVLDLPTEVDPSTMLFRARHGDEGRMEMLDQ